ncbi:MAG: hypothetical protein AAB801_00990 [Patescibacteria group bacterium]
MKIKKSEKPILKTLLYSDVFDYPLTESEVWKYLISRQKIKISEFNKTIKKINSVVFRKEMFLYMEDRESIFEKRMKRDRESERKLRLARPVIKKLSVFPGVMFIGISGSLSMKNSDKEDDIDLFVIARAGTIWTTRLFLILYLKILGLHRGRGDQKISDKFCLNMMMDDKNLSLSKNYRNIYTAHEVVQLLPVISRDNTYKNFLVANDWVLEFLPNAFQGLYETIKIRSVAKSWIYFLKLFEKTAKSIQVYLINKNKTNEKIQEGFLAFHPGRTDKKIMSKYIKNLVKYNLS